MMKTWLLCNPSQNKMPLFVLLCNSLIKSSCLLKYQNWFILVGLKNKMTLASQTDLTFVLFPSKNDVFTLYYKVSGTTRSSGSRIYETNIYIKANRIISTYLQLDAYGIDFVYISSSETQLSISFYEVFVQILSVVNLSYNKTLEKAHYSHLERATSRILLIFAHLGMGRITPWKHVPVSLTREAFYFCS